MPTFASLGQPELTANTPPARLKRDLLATIAGAINSHPRSLQERIGPSEMGSPCLRRTGFRLSGISPVPKVQDSHSVPWRPTVGTAVHRWLADVFDMLDPLHESWLTEHSVMVGTVDGQDVWGSCDLYHRDSATVVDWKVVGASTLRAVRANGPSDVYRTQVHLYGQGFRNAGQQVRHVAIMFLPMAGELADAVWWTEPFSEGIAADALATVGGLAKALRLAGPDVVIPALPTAQHYCTGCPWFSYGADSTSHTMCPGHVEPTQREQVSA
jgi:hypothetical protein